LISIESSFTPTTDTAEVEGIKVLAEEHVDGEEAVGEDVFEKGE